MGLVAAMLVLRKNTSEPGARSTTGLRFRSYLTPWHIDGKAIGG